MKEEHKTLSSFTNKPLLSLDKVSHTIGSKRLLDTISLTINTSEFVAVIGANGAGKSTLFKLIIGDLTLTSGHIIFADKALSEWQAKEKALRIAVLPQFSVLNFPYSVAEVVHLGRIPHKTGRQQDDSIVDQLLSILDLTHLSQRAYTALSGGEKQRTQLARVLAQLWPHTNDGKPKLLLLDEPTSSLDIAHQQQLMSYLSQLKKYDITVVMIAHDINLATHYCERIIALKQGKLVAQGATNTIVDKAFIHTVYNTHANILRDPQTQKLIVTPYASAPSENKI